MFLRTIRAMTPALAIVAAILSCGAGSLGSGSALRDQASVALRRAAAFFREEVASHGGYVWRYSSDLSRREGEARVTNSTIWVQDPATPSVGIAFLESFESTGDPYYLEAAREAANALVDGQLRSGGWDYRIDFDANDRLRYAYRVDSREGGIDSSTLDDGTTQGALRLLMRVDRALDFRDQRLHRAARYGLASLVRAQYPNGAWPQRYDGPPDVGDDYDPLLRASFPTRWSRTWTEHDYRSYYTFNDNVIGSAVEVLLEANAIYGVQGYRQAAERAGGFIIRAQLPDPQSAWAQQYDHAMHPAWARIIEPPAVTGGESQGAVLALIRLYWSTGDRKYLEPIPRALEYFRRSELPGGRLARFYELHTNRPLYITKNYALTYSTNDLLPNYAFSVPSLVDSLERDYQRALQQGPIDPSRPEERSPLRVTTTLEGEVQALIASQDGRGAWVEPGRLRKYGSDDPTRSVIECRTFIRNVTKLARYLDATRGGD